MAITCWVSECNHNNLREGCKFYRFPKDDDTLKKWLMILKRDVNPEPHDRVCSCHFPDGEKQNLPGIE